MIQIGAIPSFAPKRVTKKRTGYAVSSSVASLSHQVEDATSDGKAADKVTVNKKVKKEPEVKSEKNEKKQAAAKNGDSDAKAALYG